MASVLDFEPHQMLVKGVGSIQLGISKTGHLELPFDFEKAKCRVVDFDAKMYIQRDPKAKVF